MLEVRFERYAAHCEAISDYEFEDGRCSLSTHFVTMLNPVSLFASPVRFSMEMKTCERLSCSQNHPASLQKFSDSWYCHMEQVYCQLKLGF